MGTASSYEKLNTSTDDQHETPQGDSSSKADGDREDYSKGAVACRGIARILLFFLVSASLIASRLSFAILVAQFGFEQNDSNRTNVSGYGSDEARSQSDGVFWLLLLVVCVPYAFSFLRCAYRGTTKTRRIIGLGSGSRNSRPSPGRGITVYPWPERRKIVLVCGCVAHHVWC